MWHSYNVKSTQNKFQLLSFRILSTLKVPDSLGQYPVFMQILKSYFNEIFLKKAIIYLVGTFVFSPVRTDRSLF